MADVYKNQTSGEKRWLIGEAAGAGTLMRDSYVVTCNEAGDLLVSRRDEFYRTHRAEVANG